MKKQLAFIWIAILSFHFANAQTNWTLQKDKNDVKVWTKTISGQKLKASKAEMIVDASAERILEVLNDIPNYTAWTPKTESAKFLTNSNLSDYYYYTVINAPLVSNRDLVVHVKTTTSGGVTTVNMTGDPDYIDEVEDLVRMPSYSGKYVLTPQGDGTTKILLEYSANPGGNLPEWMVNTAAVDVPYNMFRDFRDLL